MKSLRDIVENLFIRTIEKYVNDKPPHEGKVNIDRKVIILITLINRNSNHTEQFF